MGPTQTHTQRRESNLINYESGQAFLFAALLCRSNKRKRAGAQEIVRETGQQQQVGTQMRNIKGTSRRQRRRRRWVFCAARIIELAKCSQLD